MKYQDFVVQLGISPVGALQIRVHKSPAGEGEITIGMPVWLRELAFSFADAPHRGPAEEVQRDLRRRKETLPVAEEIGGQLHDLIFSGVVGRLWDQSLGAISGRQDAGLRLRLQIALEQAEFLGDLPWELLHSRHTGAYLGLDSRTPILRHLEVAQPLLPQKLPASLKVLGVASAPQELASLDLASEKQQLQASKKRRGWQVSFLEQPTVEQLRQSLVDQGSHVLHFMGHGSFDPESREGALYFEDGQGQGAPFTGSALAAKLAGAPSLRLVVLNACDTAVSGAAGNAYGGVAAALVRSGLPAVIAMQRPISDKAAIAFSSAFYHHLATGADLESALTEGRQAIHTLNPSGIEWSIPVLFSRFAERGLFSNPEALAVRRWKLAGAAAALVVLSLGVPQMREAIVGQKAYAVELEQILATGVDGLQGRLVSIEILEDGRMRLHFAFENQTDKGRRLGFDFVKTYLADEFGNAYEVRASSAPKPTIGALIETVPAGESREYWVEFQAPQDGARRLHVELATPENSETKFLPFSVVLPAYPKNLSVPSPCPARLAESDALPMEVRIDNGRKDVLSQIRQLEVSENGMRVSFDMWNRGSLPLKADFDPAGIEFRDAQGNVLRPTRMGTFEEGRESDLRVDAMLRRAVRTRLFVDFPPPRTRSEKWELRLATRPKSEFSFANAALQVTTSIFDRARKKIEELAHLARPKLQARPRVDPPSAPPQPPAPTETKVVEPVAAPVTSEARFEVESGSQEVASSSEGIRTRILGIERLSNQRLRFVVTLANVDSAPARVGLWLGGTKLSDDQGRQFRLLASTFGEVGEGGPEEVSITLAPDSARELTFEFSGRIQGSEYFTFQLGSADPDALRFKPIQTRLPPE